MSIRTGPSSGPSGVALLDPTDGPTQLLALVHRISAGDRDAFASLHELLSATILAKLRSMPLDADTVVAVASATFAEVWWLARFHSSPRTDVDAWVSDIALRRAADRAPVPDPYSELDPLSDPGRAARCRALGEFHDRQGELALAALLAVG
jgi:hypothetical protein